MDLDSHPIAETDANGEYRVDLKVGRCGINVSYQFAQFVREGISVREGQSTVEDIVLDDEAVHVRSKDYSRTCPTSGNTASEEIGASPVDVDEIAKVVFSRFATYPNYLSGWNPARTDIGIAMFVERPVIRLDTAVVPVGGKYRFRLVSAEEARTLRRVKQLSTEILALTSVHSDGTCALVGTSLRHSLDVDVYEKRDGSWQFVRRVGGAFY